MAVERWPLWGGREVSHDTFFLQKILILSAYTYINQNLSITQYQSFTKNDKEHIEWPFTIKSGVFYTPFVSY